MSLDLDPNDAQKIFNYLIARPYAEVYELVPILIALKEKSPVPEEEADSDLAG